MKRMTAYWWDKDKNAVAISYKDNRLILTVDDAQALLRQLEMLLPEGPSRDEPEEPKSYLRCPYCGHAPIIVTGKCTYHNPRHTVYRYECDLRCLQGEVCQTAEAAFDSWVRIVARYYDAENAIRQFRKEKKS